MTPAHLCNFNLTSGGGGVTRPLGALCNFSKSSSPLCEFVVCNYWRPQVYPKMTPKWSQGDPKMIPRWSQNDAKMIPRWSQNDPNMIPKWSQDDPKMIPRWSQNDPKMIPKWSQDDPKWSQNDTKMIPNWSQYDPKLISKLPSTLQFYLSTVNCWSPNLLKTCGGWIEIEGGRFPPFGFNIMELGSYAVIKLIFWLNLIIR